MRRIILVMLTLIFCLSWAEVKVEKVLETTSIKEYNQWVQRNKTKYPGLKPILVDYIAELSGQHKKFTINYYSDNGKRIKKEVVEDSLTYIWIGIPKTADRVILYRTGDYEPYGYKTTVKDKKGGILFSYHMPLDYIGIGDIYFASNLGEDAYAYEETEVTVLNKTGKEIAKLKGFGGIEGSSLQIPNDERYIVFRGYLSHGNMPCIMIDKYGNEVWRKDLEGIRSIFISKNGSMVGINANTKMIYVYKEDGKLFRTYNPFGNKEFDIKASFSENGDWLITGLHSTIKFYNNKTGDLMWSNDTTLAKNNEKIRYVHVLDDGDKILVLCRSHNLYIFNKEHKLLKITNLNLGEWLEPKPNQKNNVKTLVQNWHTDVIGNYLIITQGRETGSIVGTKGLKRIVYRISGDD